MTARPETRPAVDDLQALDELTLHHRVSQFLYREARLQDTHDYQGWGRSGRTTPSTGFRPMAGTSIPNRRCR